MNSLKKTLLSLALFASRGPIGKGARHLLNLAAGWLAASPLMGGHGAVDPNSLWSLLVAVLMLLVSALWSAMVKKPLTGQSRDTVRLVIEALLNHLVPAISGLMIARGYAGGPDDAGGMVEWGLAALVNYVRSVLQAPDRIEDRGSRIEGPDFGSDDFPPGVLVLPFVLCLGLSSCASRTEIPAAVRDWRFGFCVELPVGQWLSGIREDSRREITESTGLEVVESGK